jgi:Bax protein
MIKAIAAKRVFVGLERRVVLVGSVMVAATLVANFAQRMPTLVPDTATQTYETIPLPAAPAPVAQQSLAPQKPHKPQSDERTITVAKLSQMFARYGYDLETVRAEGLVPRLYLATLPPDLPDTSDSDARKITFIQTVLPLVLHVNETIAHDRARIVALRKEFKRTKTLKDEDRAWLVRVASAYSLDQDADFDELLQRVDAVPPSLAVAQAALESGWGTSRVAHEGKALFGQYGLYGEGPAQSEDAKNYRMRYFATLSDAVKSYAANLNTNAAYERFRKVRAEMRAKGLEPDGYDLAAEITAYSELRGAYVKSIRRLIDLNALSRFDDVRLVAHQSL